MGIIKTKKGENFEETSRPPGLSSPDLPLIPIVGAILAILIILIVLIDLIFYKTKQIGITYLLCQQSHVSKKFDPKKERAEEEDPLIYSQKKHSQVSVNKSGNNRTIISNG